MNLTRCSIVSIFAAILLLSAMACGASDLTESDATEMNGTPTGEVAPAKATRGEVLQSLTARVILPGYSAAAAGLTKLELSVGSLCSNPGEDALTSARDDWRDARRAWLRTESFRFGPAMERRSLSLVDWWPIDTVKIDRNLASQEAITEERVSEFLSATQRGLATAEYLLFGQGSDSLAGGPGGWERCAYLQAVVGVASREVGGILADWRGADGQSGYAGYFDGTGSLALLDSEAEAEAVRSLVFQVRAIANMRLGAALGVDVDADASEIPSGDADSTGDDLLAQVEGIAAIYRGVDGGLGLSARVAAVSEEADARMLSAIESTIDAARNMEGSVFYMLETDPAQVRLVYDNLKELQRVLNTEIVSLLGVSVGFSDTDGDS